MPLVDETHNTIDREIFYKDLELNILKSMQKINDQIFTIQELIIEYEQFGQKEINDFKPFVRNYPFQISFDEFSPSNYWGCEGDEEFLNNPPTREKEKEINEKKWVKKIFFSHDEREEFINKMVLGETIERNNFYNVHTFEKTLVNGTHGKEFILHLEIDKNKNIPEFEEE